MNADRECRQLGSTCGCVELFEILFNGSSSSIHCRYLLTGPCFLWFCSIIHYLSNFEHLGGTDGGAQKGVGENTAITLYLQASSPITSRAHQVYSAVAGVTGYGPYH